MAGNKRGITQLRVGRLSKAHGLKGALKLELYTDEPEKRFVPGASFSLQVPSTSPWKGKKLVLRELRWFNEAPVGFFEDVTDRTTAETLVKAILWVDQDDAEELDPDTWYDHQLIDLEVVLDGKVVGKVTRVNHLPAQDLLEIETPNGSVMVPFVKAIVPEVNIAAGTITVTPPRGLFDAENAENAAADAVEAAIAKAAAADIADAAEAEDIEAEPAEPKPDTNEDA
ncbi:ribosome maturation factor RimM [Gulosibacter chungangensis]|uniref:ribosome maturation factor RimM n=1 Tax=Gulosibacter chungangensis TaxID=979746 RepID=UPI001CE3E1DF|nr:ribosome maturation factor RimM [Gulosibacter chungangensis]